MNAAPSKRRPRKKQPQLFKEQPPINLVVIDRDLVDGVPRVILEVARN